MILRDISCTKIAALQRSMENLKRALSDCTRMSVRMSRGTKQRGIDTTMFLDGTSPARASVKKRKFARTEKCRGSGVSGAGSAELHVEFDRISPKLNGTIRTQSSECECIQGHL